MCKIQKKASSVGLRNQIHTLRKGFKYSETDMLCKKNNFRAHDDASAFKMV